MRFRAHDDQPAGRGVFQRVIEEIRYRLLHLLVIELENGQLIFDANFEANMLPLKRLIPSRGELDQAIPEIVLPYVQHKLAAFESRIVQEHRDQTNQPFGTVFRLLKNVSLLVVQLSEGAGQQEIVISLDHS